MRGAVAFADCWCDWFCESGSSRGTGGLDGGFGVSVGTNKSVGRPVTGAGFDVDVVAAVAGRIAAVTARKAAADTSLVAGCESRGASAGEGPSSLPGSLSGPGRRKSSEPMLCRSLFTPAHGSVSNLSIGAPSRLQLRLRYGGCAPVRCNGSIGGPSCELSACNLASYDKPRQDPQWNPRRMSAAPRDEALSRGKSRRHPQDASAANNHKMRPFSINLFSRIF
jgi:hypothetical protein